MTHSVVEDGSGKEVLYPGPDPLGVGQHAHGGPGEHIDEGQNRQQEGCLFFADVFILGKIGEEDERSKEAEEHEDVAAEVQQEAAVFEQRQVDEGVDGLHDCLFLLWLHLIHCLAIACLRVGLLRLRFGSDGAHEGSGHAAVEQKSSQDEEAASPPKLIIQPGVEGSQRGQKHWAACHGDAVGDRPTYEEVFTDHGEGWIQVERQSQPWREENRKVGLCKNRENDMWAKASRYNNTTQKRSKSILLQHISCKLNISFLKYKVYMKQKQPQAAP